MLFIIIFTLYFKELYNMEEKNYLHDIREIKSLMNRSSRFMSLSGLSGILVGVYALIGAGIAYFYFLPNEGDLLLLHSHQFKILVFILIGVFVLSLATAIGLTIRKTKKNNEKIWDPTTQKLLISFLIPFVVGAAYILIKLNSQHYGLTASLMLIFYGLALVNASKYTFGHVQYLGYVQIILGLICAIFPGYGLWFWAAGFGLGHIVYGTVMYCNEIRK